MEVNLLVYLGVIFAAAYAVKAVTRRIGVPEVTGYVILGVLMGGSVSRLLNTEILGNLQPVANLALGIIAFIIGIELKFATIRKLGRSIVWIVLFEGLGTFGVVFTVLFFAFPGNLELAMLLAAVAAATAPAATVAVIRQYRAKGTLTSTVLAVVGIDDALALVIYVVVASLAKELLAGASIEVGRVVLAAVASLGMSLGLGVVSAALFVVVLRKVRNPDWITLLLAAAVLLVLGICEMLGVSELLAVMVFGAFVTNANTALARRSEAVVEGLSPIFLAAFFVLGGAHLNVALIAKIGILGLIYFGARSSGKILFASLGALIGGAEKKVRRGIGFMLLPQVGVALALALAINNDFTVARFGVEGKELATSIINVLLFTTILTEIVGPFLTGLVLRRAGETHPESE